MRVFAHCKYTFCTACHSRAAPTRTLNITLNNSLCAPPPHTHTSTLIQSESSVDENKATKRGRGGPIKKVAKSRADGARQSQRRRAEGSYMEEDSEGDENIDTMMDITCVVVSRIHIMLPCAPNHHLVDT